MVYRTAVTIAASLTTLLLPSCGTSPYAGPEAPLRYTGSSTIAQFIRDVEQTFPRARFTIDTSGESSAGEQAILSGTTDLAGVANQPKTRELPAGVRSAVIGRDAIAVIVNSDVPVGSISLADLRRIFTGEIRNWKSLAGGDAAIRPLIVDAGSATHTVFRDAVLPGAEYGNCTVVRPDRAIIERVANTPGAIGHISFSFLSDSAAVRTIAVDGEAPTVTNFSYPIARPLYLLWRDSNAEARAFVEWARSTAGQRLVMNHFVGERVVDVVPREATGRRGGYLVVNTETYPVYDGGIDYYPHRPYDVLTRYGELIRHVRNHRSQNDEHPTRLALPPGTYLVRPYSSRGAAREFFVTIKLGETTEVSPPKRR